jgi:hypothetical protein
VRLLFDNGSDISPFQLCMSTSKRVSINTKCGMITMQRSGQMPIAKIQFVVGTQPTVRRSETEIFQCGHQVRYLPSPALPWKKGTVPVDLPPIRGNTSQPKDLDEVGLDIANCLVTSCKNCGRTGLALFVLHAKNNSAEMDRILTFLITVPEKWSAFALSGTSDIPCPAATSARIEWIWLTL